jgi:two-component system LytT family sensor kinase
MPGLSQPLLINILGHAGGALIFAIFLGLLFSARGWAGSRGRTLSALAASLSLAWNLGSLVVLMWPGLSPPLLNLVVAISFSVLSLLPAVLLHISLEGAQPRLVAAGYLLSSTAVVMHFWEIRGNGATLHQTALLIITGGFLALTAIAVAAIWLRRGGPQPHGGARITASMCLALFAMSFVHFGSGHAAQVWSSELVVHHAGIPLALFVLLQDYRFVLLDAFVRFLANALLAAVLTGLVIEAAFRLVLVERIAPEPLQEALLLVSVCLFLVFFAWLRNRVQAWLTHAVFRHGDLDSLSPAVKNCPAPLAEAPYLEWAAATMAAAVKAARHAVVARNQPADAAGLPAWAEAMIPVRLGPGDTRLVLLGRRRGGQRYLGEDLEALGKAAAVIGEHVESLRQQEMNRLVSQAELRALQSQINPHFLFNALNTLYGTIPRESADARRMVLNLAEIFRYFLQTAKTFVTLSEEMQIVRAYLEVEQLRLGHRLNVDIQVDDAALDLLIPVLSIQPLVENAVKHGVALRTEPGYVRIQVTRGAGELRILVENSASGAPVESEGTGVGLQNVRRRLEICYGAGAGLQLAFHEDTTAVELWIPLLHAASTVDGAARKPDSRRYEKSDLPAADRG